VAVRNGAPDAALGDGYPFEDRYVQLSDGTIMHYVEAGSAGLRRPTYLLVHGNPTWSYMWRRVIPLLAASGRVVAVDHVGFGRSDHPADLGYHTLDRHIRNLCELAAELRLRRVIPVVHDWGGPIGLGYALQAREDLQGLALLNTWAFTRRMPVRLPAVYRVLRSKGVGTWLVAGRNVVIEQALPRMLAEPDASMEGYRHPFPNVASRAALVAFPRMVPDKPQHPDWATLDRIDHSLPELDVPASIVWGAQDPVFPKRFAWAFREALPKAREPVFIAGAGHFVAEDRPGPVAREIENFAAAL
jgi:pimeloyl-ACP methyl ester carboxylesterase